MYLYKVKLTSRNCELILMNFVDVWKQNSTLEMRQQKSLAIYLRVHPNLLGCHWIDTQILKCIWVKFKIKFLKLPKSDQDIPLWAS